MKINYRGFELDARREKCMGGWDLLYYSIFRISDGYEVTSSFTYGSDKIRDFIKEMKVYVDDFIANPKKESE
jgi:hypothetical protein